MNNATRTPWFATLLCLGLRKHNTYLDRSADGKIVGISRSLAAAFLL